MSNVYEITKIADIANLEDDQIDRFCAELPDVLKHAKHMQEIANMACESLGMSAPSMEVLEPLQWIDDGKQELTVSITNGDETLVTAMAKPKAGEE